MRSRHNTESHPHWAETPLLIRHDITRQAFQPNNPSISPQIAKSNVLANSKEDDLQIVGNIWSTLQRAGIQLFKKIKMQMISCLELTVPLCQQSLISGMRPELYTNRNGLVCIYFVVRDHTAEAIYGFDSALNATRKRTPGLRLHRAWQQVLHHRANDAPLCLHITRVASTIYGFLTMPSRHPLCTSKSTTSFGIIFMDRIIFFQNALQTGTLYTTMIPAAFGTLRRTEGSQARVHSKILPPETKCLAKIESL